MTDSFWSSHSEIKSLLCSEMLKGHATVICCIYSDPERNEKTLCAIRERERDGGNREHAHMRERYIPAQRYPRDASLLLNLSTQNVLFITLYNSILTIITHIHHNIRKALK